MKKIVAGLALILASYSAQAACQITYVSASEEVQKYLRKNGFTNNNYDAICAKLKSANARLTIVAASTVLAGKSVGWVHVGVMDLPTNIAASGHGSVSTTVN
ncbi:MAG TPA: hypothetical protein VFX55_18925, partial [Duganella sp.]|nr:hypothetical protein [Duganella sp.]